MKTFNLVKFEGVRKDTGAKFTYFRHKDVDLNNNIIWTDVRFTRACEQEPYASCEIEVEDEDYNYDEDSHQYPCFWIKHIKRIIYKR